MNKIDLFSIFLYIVFAFIIVLVTVAVAAQVWTTYLIKSDVPMYKKPTLQTEATTTTTTGSTTITVESETTMTVIEFDAEYYED